MKELSTATEFQDESAATISKRKNGFFAKLIGSVKSRFKATDISWIFDLPLSDKIQKVKRQPTLIISFSWQSPFFEGQ